MSVDTHSQALELLRDGLQPVRLAPRGKNPVEPGWQKRIHDAASIVAEFQRGENIGALMGEPSGWVVDIDIDSLDAVKLAADILPATLCFGRESKPLSHYLYQVTNAKNRVWMAPNGAHIVNLRSTGNQTMMPGSIHPLGEPVRWANTLPIASIEAHELTALLDTLALRCGWERPAERVTAQRSTNPRPAASGLGYGPAALSAELATLASTGGGGRNTQLNTSAFATAQLINAGELDATALDAVRGVALSIGLTPNEVDNTIRSAQAAALRNPRAPRETLNMTHEPTPKPNREDVRKHSSGLVASLMDELAQTQGRKHGGIDVPDFPHLTDALFGFSGFSLFTGPSGMGKTTLVNGMATSVAKAGKVPVVYMTAEMSPTEVVESMLASMSPIAVRDLRIGAKGGVLSAEGFTQRLLLTSEHRAAVEREASRLHTLIDSGALDVIDARKLVRSWDKSNGEHALSGLSDAVEALHPGRQVLVIVDTLATLCVRAAHGEKHKTDLDTDADIVDGLISWRAALPTGSCALCVHEENKSMTGSGDGHSARGSSRYFYSCTQRLNLVDASSPGGTRMLKLRYGEPEDGVRELDIQISKARGGGRAGSVIPLEFNWSTGRFTEFPSFSQNEIAAAKSKGAK